MLLEKVVLGHSVESAMFAYLNGYYHIQTSSFYPLFFKEFQEFKLFGTRNKKQIWQKIKLHLGLLALGIDYAEVKQVRVTENNIKIFSDNLLAQFEFEQCFIFETLNIKHENALSGTHAEEYEVIDDFTIQRLGKQAKHINPVYTEDRLLSEIYFYNSLRVDGAKHITDIVTVSQLTRDQLYDFDYSDTIANFKLKSHLNSMGYIGLKEKGKYKNGTDIYKKLITSHLSRYVHPIDQNTYSNSKKVKFMNMSMQEIIDGYSPKR